MAGTFLLGVGCQKGGTAWLHRYLEGSPQCDPGFRKEYHVWDGLDLRRELARERIEKQGGQRAAFLHEPESYFDYFTGLLEPTAIRLTADITPGYAALSAERLTRSRPASSRAAYGQPRSTSSATRSSGSGRPPGWTCAAAATNARDPETRVSHMYKHPMYADRTRYDVTMDALERAFPRADVFYGFYERLFTVETLAPLCEFLGIDFHEPNTDRQVNVSPKSEGAALPEDTRRTIARHFAPVYDAVQSRFPDLDLAALWPSMRLL